MVNIHARFWRPVIGMAFIFAATGGALAAEEDNFKDCAVVNNSIATPFIQSRTQLAILRFESSRGNQCNYVEFRIAEVQGDPKVEMRDDVRIQTWEERWGVNLCGESVAYHVWYKEIGLGGTSFHVEREKYTPLDFEQRIASGIALPPPPVIEPGAQAESSSKDVSASVQPAAAANSAEDATSSWPRDLTLISPAMKGHDVCAVQRALLDKGMNIVVDGVFGPGMKKVVKAYQKREGLKTDGIVTAETRNSLGNVPAPIAESSSASATETKALPEADKNQ